MHENNATFSLEFGGFARRESGWGAVKKL